jgi:hypothetical protein
MRLNLFGAAALTAILAGCGQSETKATPPAPPAAAAATVDPGAEAFVRSLYSPENGGTSANTDGDKIWSARATALIAEADTLTKDGEEGFFEADPICACSDDGGMQLTSVTVTPKDADHADAAVVMTWTLAQPVETIRQTYNLVRENGIWKIDDIQRDQTREFPQKPLVEAMTAWIADARAHPST